MTRNLKELASFLKNQSEVTAAYLFGSSVFGQMTPESDLDLALLLDPSVPGDRYFEFKTLFQSRAGFPHLDNKLDLVILNESSPLLSYEILKKGELVDCKDRRRLVFYIARAIQRYLDTAHLRSQQFAALNKRIKEGQFGHLQGSDSNTLEEVRDLHSKIASSRKDE